MNDGDFGPIIRVDQILHTNQYKIVVVEDDKCGELTPLPSAARLKPGMRSISLPLSM
jgi:hypothetical protein